MGTLYLVATPIGNLEDITLRALRILREVALIAAEDTRHTRKLLNHFEIATQAVSYHEHSPQARLDALLAVLATGDVALVSDAGTPALSDPGQELVRATIAAGYQVTPVPGPAAVITALIASGLSTDTFTYLGFLPRRPVERREALMRVRDQPHTLVLYESPHRLLACLDDVQAVLGDREMVAARELTKLHEEWARGTISKVRARYADGGGPRGEFTLVIAGATSARPDAVMDERERAVAIEERLRELLAQGRGTREAAALVSGEFVGTSKRDAYQMALRLGMSQDEE